jgi:RNA polymerase sigma-70 factor, ECF subfamily
MRVDEVSIRGFLHTEYPRLVAAVALACGSRPAAEDAVQEALVRAWERSERGQEVDSLPRWVAAVALNLARSGLRRRIAERRARSRMTIDERTDPFGDRDDRLDVARALEHLPRREREAVILRYYLRFDTKETAETLGVHEGTVKTSLSRARARLAEALGVDNDEEANDRGAR